ncbi:MAG: OB-fold domain-containing protein [Cyanobacteriota bacterium]
MSKLKIYGYKCKNCGKVHYPHKSLCKNCKHDMFEDFEQVELPTNGKLLTFTNLHTPSGDFDVPILKLGIVELENGNRITGQLNIDEPKIGMSVKGVVKTVRKSDYENYKGIVFSKA